MKHKVYFWPAYVRCGHCHYVMAQNRINQKRESVIYCAHEGCPAYGCHYALPCTELELTEVEIRT